MSGLVEVRIGDWIVTGDGYVDLYGPVEQVTKARVMAPVFGMGFAAHRPRAEVLFAGTETAAKRLHNKLKSMGGDHDRRQREAEERHRAAILKAAEEERARATHD